MIGTEVIVSVAPFTIIVSYDPQDLTRAKANLRVIRLSCSTHGACDLHAH